MERELAGRTPSAGLADGLRRAPRRLVPAFTCASAFMATGALWTVLVCWAQGWSLALEPASAVFVALPAFLGGALFFPVDARALASRLSLAGRAMAATALGAAAHRLLLLRGAELSRSGASLVEAARWSARALLSFTLHPTLAALSPGPDTPRLGGLDAPLIAECVAVLGAGALALAVQPALRRALRSPQGRSPAASEATGLR